MSGPGPLLAAAPPQLVFTGLLDDGIARRALAAVVVVGVLCGIVGVQVVLRRLSFFTMAMTHATFPGVVLASIVGVDLLLGSAAFGLVVVLGFALLTARGRVEDTSAVGVVLSAGLALGTLLLSAQAGFTRDLAAFLVGDPLAVTRHDVVSLLVVLLVVGGVLVAVSKELVLGAFDRASLAAAGYPLLALDLVLLVAIETTVVACVRAVGTILSVALIVAPAAAARQWTDRVLSMTLLACAIGVASGVGGIVVTENADLAGGASIVVIATAVFVLSLLLAPLGRRVGGRRGRRAPSAPRTAR